MTNEPSTSATPSSPTSGNEGSGSGAEGQSTPTSTESSAPESGGDAFDFGSIYNDDVSSEPAVTVAPTPAAAEPAAPTGAEPAAQPQVPPSPAQEPVISAPQSPGQQGPEAAPAASPEAQTSPPPLDTSDPAALAGALLQNRALVEAEVAKQLFVLSPEEVEALETNAVEAVPRLLAKTYVAAQAAMLQQLNRFVPLMLDRYSQVTRRHQANEDKFYARWKGLSREKHGATVMRYATVLRQGNPNLTLDQMIEQLGPLVHQLTGTPVPTAVPAAANGRAPASAAFTPAMSGAAGLPQTQEPGAFDFMGMHDGG